MKNSPSNYWGRPWLCYRPNSWYPSLGYCGDDSKAQSVLEDDSAVELVLLELLCVVCCEWFVATWLFLNIRPAKYAPTKIHSTAIMTSTHFNFFIFNPLCKYKGPHYGSLILIFNYPKLPKRKATHYWVTYEFRHERNYRIVFLPIAIEWFNS